VGALLAAPCLFFGEGAASSAPTRPIRQQHQLVRGLWANSVVARPRKSFIIKPILSKNRQTFNYFLS
ncbi:MAG: hypothetical protein JXQ72_08950, partial [Anaerolineae bacterium]|nr:hypothetical protein [Anaerolineae bacterium]